MNQAVFSLFCAGIIALLSSAMAQGGGKRFPAPGIPVPEKIAEALREKLGKLQAEIRSIREVRKGDNGLQVLPDIEIHEKAVRWALEYNEFYRTNEFEVANRLIAEGLKRAEDFRNGRLGWTADKGLLVRGYRSRIDGSVQPYGLIVPESYRPGEGRRYRLDVWLHGRDETLTELKFINERMTKVGEFAPKDAFVLHPYGRYCNAFKFAGEVDVLEAIQAVREQYAIDPSRIAMRGFSMGGAGVWHLATHHADQWVCAAPGAGFAETAAYLKVRKEKIADHERVLWQMYDATDYALNLYHCPTIAYSGELDKQRQAADVMELALRAEGLPLVHLIGAQTEHRYQPETKQLLSTLVDALAAKGKDPEPNEIRFTTRTLRYPKMHWFTALGMEKHWERADVRGRLMSNRVKLSLTNITSFALHLSPESAGGLRELEVNGKNVELSGAKSITTPDFLIFSRTNNTWMAGGSIFSTMTKGPGHQGPIDDAFMDAFVFVAPSAKGFHAETSAFVTKELERAVFEWRAQFRGDAKVLSAVDYANHPHSNLVLWGDPQSNELIQKILPQLPLKWTEREIEFAGRKYDAQRHVPLMIFPNPLNPERYVVLNSGLTFRGFGSNANQTPKLPDYAILDVSKDDPFANGVTTAGFFDEQWQVK